MEVHSASCVAAAAAAAAAHGDFVCAFMYLTCVGLSWCEDTFGEGQGRNNASSCTRKECHARARRWTSNDASCASCKRIHKTSTSWLNGEQPLVYHSCGTKICHHFCLHYHAWCTVRRMKFIIIHVAVLQIAFLIHVTFSSNLEELVHNVKAEWKNCSRSTTWAWATRP